jgi:hypothetical protein
LAENLRIAHQTGALRSNDLARVTMDTTAQPKAITFSTDAKLLHAAISLRAATGRSFTAHHDRSPIQLDCCRICSTESALSVSSATAIGVGFGGKADVGQPRPKISVNVPPLA